MFNPPIYGVVWPDSMQQLTFGPDFDQSIDDVVWPPSLQQLTFGHNFNQPVINVVWPTRFQMLSFGRCPKCQINPVGRLGVGALCAINKSLNISSLPA